MVIEKEEKCKFCGALIFMQPGQSHREGSHVYCNTSCAYDYRQSLVNNKTQIMKGL